MDVDEGFTKNLFGFSSRCGHLSCLLGLSSFARLHGWSLPAERPPGASRTTTQSSINLATRSQRRRASVCSDQRTRRLTPRGGTAAAALKRPSPFSLPRTTAFVKSTRHQLLPFTERQHTPRCAPPRPPPCTRRPRSAEPCCCRSWRRRRRWPAGRGAAQQVPAGAARL